MDIDQWIAQTPLAAFLSERGTPYHQETEPPQMPSWARWKAQDGNGCWHYFKNRPAKDIPLNRWITRGKWAPAGVGEVNPRWEGTLSRVHG